MRKPERKKPLGRPRHRGEDKMDLQKVAKVGLGQDWPGPGQGKAAGTCKCGNEPSGFP